MVSETAAQIAARLGAHLAPGVAVTRVPAGVSAYAFDPATGAIILAKYLDAAPAVKKQVMRDTYARSLAMRGRAGGPRDAEVQRRRDDVRSWHAKGLCNADIAAVAQLPLHIVVSDLYRMNLSANRAPPKVRPVTETPAEVRLRTIREMLSLGHTPEDIAVALSLSQSGLHQVAAKAGIVLPWAGGKPGTRPYRRMAAKDPVLVERRARLTEMYGRGMLLRAIADALGVPLSCVHSDVYRLGLKRDLLESHPQHPSRRSAAAMHRATIAEGIAAGEAPRAIAERIGITHKSVLRIVAQLRAAGAGKGKVEAA